MTKKDCIFCGEPLKKGDNKAKEHVLRESWLRKLDALKTNVIIDRFKSTTLTTEKREMVAGSVVTGEVCKCCNNGWMNRLDVEIEHLVLQSAVPGLPAELPENSRLALARYLLKTACVFLAADEPGRRKVSPQFFRNVGVENHIPSGFLAFASHTTGNPKPVALSHLDFWYLEDSPRANTFMNSERFKFVVRYQNLLLGCSYVSLPNPMYSLPQGIQVIYAEDCLWRIRAGDDRFLMPQFIAPFPTNDLLVQITVDA